MRAALGPLAAVAIAALAGCGGSGGPKAVVHVGSQAITENDLAPVVDQLEEPLRERGTPLPKQGSAQFRRLERSALTLLVYRSELEQRAKEVGVTVTDAEVQARVKAAGLGVDANVEAAAGSIRQELVYDKVFAHVAGGVTVTDAEIRSWYRAHRSFFGTQTLAQARASIQQQLLAAKRNAAMTGFIGAMKREFASKVSYEAGFAP